jgi:hypothetical protein
MAFAVQVSHGGSLVFGMSYAMAAPGGDAMPGRELMEPNRGDKRYVRRDERGRFKEVDDVGRSLSQDRRTEAENTAKKGQGDRGDRKRGR